MQVGAGGVLTAFARATLPEAEAAGERRPGQPRGGRPGAAFQRARQGLTAGIDLDTTALFEGRDPRLVTLPPTPLDTSPYWPVEPSRTPAEPLRLPSGTEEITQMDPLVALFREQVALLQQQARVLEQQAAALAGKGVALPQLSSLPQIPALPASPAAVAAQPVPAPQPLAPRRPKADDDRVARTIT